MRGCSEVSYKLGGGGGGGREALRLLGCLATRSPEALVRTNQGTVRGAQSPARTGCHTVTHANCPIGSVCRVLCAGGAGDPPVGAASSRRSRGSGLPWTVASRTYYDTRHDIDFAQSSFAPRNPAGVGWTFRPGNGLSVDGGGAGGSVRVAWVGGGLRRGRWRAGLGPDGRRLLHAGDTDGGPLGSARHAARGRRRPR